MFRETSGLFTKIEKQQVIFTKRWLWVFKFSNDRFFEKEIFPYKIAFQTHRRTVQKVLWRIKIWLKIFKQGVELQAMVLITWLSFSDFHPIILRTGKFFFTNRFFPLSVRIELLPNFAQARILIFRHFQFFPLDFSMILLTENSSSSLVAVKACISTKI